MKYNYNYDDNVRKKIYNYEENKLVIWEKDQILWKNIDDCGDNDEKNKYIKFEDYEWKRKTHQFEQCTLHFTIVNNLYS